MMNKHWQPALFTLAFLPATAFADPNSEKEFEPLARNYFTIDAAASSLEATSDDDVDPLEFDVFWKDGINFRTKDKQFSAKLGGRIHHDWAWFSEDIERKSAGAVDFENGTEFRRARLFLSGKAQGDIEFKLQVDFAADATGANFKDVFVGYVPTKQTNIRVGQFNEPFSMGTVTSSNYTTFLERPISAQIADDRNVGFMFHGRDDSERTTYALGVFKDDNDVGAANAGTKGGGTSETGDYAFTGRVTRLTVDSGDNLVHIGIGVSLRNAPGGMFDADFRPSAHLAPKTINNTAFPADDVVNVNLEAAVVSGSFWAGAEVVRSEIDARDGMLDAIINGRYIEAGYFLTGETRPFKRANGTWGKVKPNHPRGGKDNGCGAFELAVRFAEVEFENLRSGGAIFTDELSDITVGLNWYLTNTARIMFNYVMFDLDSQSANTGAGLKGDGTAFQTRFSVFM